MHTERGGGSAAVVAIGNEEVHLRDGVERHCCNYQVLCFVAMPYAHLFSTRDSSRHNMRGVTNHAPCVAEHSCCFECASPAPTPRATDATLTSRGGKYVPPCLILSRLSPPKKRQTIARRGFMRLSASTLCPRSCCRGALTLLF